MIVPTDTVYGIAASFTPEAVRKLYVAKGRPETKPIPVLLADTEVALQLVSDWPPVAAYLASRYWPGALTIVVPAIQGIPREITAGGHTIGLRVPACAITRDLIRLAGGKLAVTSANVSGEPPTTTAREALERLYPSVRIAIDGGATASEAPSTVVSVSGNRLVILRRGSIDVTEIEETLREFSLREDVEIVEGT